MSFIRGLGRWLLAMFVSLGLSIWLLCTTLQLTILNRQIVKGWAQDSGIYNKAIDSIPFQVGEGKDGEGDTQSLITSSDIQAALKTTLPASYLQTQGEAILDATYDWLEGKADRITFSIPINEKKEAFSANLAAQLQPKIAALPVCTSRVAPTSDNPTCLPKGVTPEQFAAQLSDVTKSDGQGFLDQPLTEQMFKDANLSFGEKLPMAIAQLGWLNVALPAVILACAAGYVLLSNSKLHGMMIMGRRLLFQSLVVCVIGGALWYFGQNIQLAGLLSNAEDASSDALQKAVIQNIVEPILRHIMPSFGQAMTLLGGGVAIIGASVWLLATVLRKHQIGEKERFDHIEHTPNPLLRDEPDGTHIPEKPEEPEAKDKPKTPPPDKPKPPAPVVM